MKLKIRVIVFLLTVSLGGLAYSITNAYADEGDTQNSACNDQNARTCRQTSASCGESGTWNEDTCSIKCFSGPVISCGTIPSDDDPCCECELYE